MYFFIQNINLNIYFQPVFDLIIPDKYFSTQNINSNIYFKLISLLSKIQNLAYTHN